MISRRSIRVKLMQGFYSFEMNPTTSEEKVLSGCLESISRFNALMMFNLFIIEQTCNYANEYTDMLRSLRTRKVRDEELSTRISENALIQQIRKAPSYLKALKDEHFELKFDSDLFKKYFTELKNSDSYSKYIALGSEDLKDDYYIVQELYTHIIMADKDLDGLIEDMYPEWADDRHHIKSIITDILKQLSNQTTPNLNEMISAQDRNFVQSMVNAYLFHHNEITDYIKKRLTNWDEERVAELDMILLRMGVCEFIYQAEVPVKVSINEYLEIAKQYSTPKSSEFINGILDRVLKDLRAENRVLKTGRGVVESWFFYPLFCAIFADRKNKYHGRN